ncbi:hypothetical protein IMZ17_02905 [Geobacillus stearothermophilus]|nr:hypothetical protein IMZ17_02905 [Geobacillus stearothermophilus]
MPTISVKTSFQQKTNSHTPMIATPKPSSPVATSVSHSTSNTTISKDVVIISDAAKKAYQSTVSQNNASNTLTSQVVRPVSPSVPSVINSPANPNNSKDAVIISDAAKKAYQGVVSQNNTSQTVANIVTNKPSQIPAVIQGIANKNSGNFEVKTTASTSAKTANTVQASAFQVAANKKSDATDVKTLVNNLKKLEKYTKSYLIIDTTKRINDHDLEYLRSTKYDGFKWDVTAGTIDDKHVKYIESKNKKLDNFFSPNGQGAFIKDPVTGDKIDFIHMAATIDAILSNTPVPDSWAGWAGDLHTALGDLQENTKDSNKLKVLQKEAKKIIGGNSSFSRADILADVDAVNIANMMKENKNLLLSDAIKKYYSKSGDVHHRFSEFIESFGGTKKFKESVDRNLTKVDVHIKIGTADVTPISLMAPLAEKKRKKYGIPTDNQIKAIGDAFKNYIIKEASKERK